MNVLNLELNKLAVPSIEIQLLQNIYLYPKNFFKIVDIVKSSYFYSYKRQQIYSVMSRLYDEGETITYSTVIAKFASNGKLGDETDQLTPHDITNCGGEATDKQANTQPTEYLAKIIAESYIRRTFVTNCTKGIEGIFQGNDGFVKVISENAETNGQLLTVSEGNRNMMAYHYSDKFLQENQHNGGNIFKTGYHKVDDRLKIKQGHLVIIGAGTSHGKTAFALNIVRNIAIEKKKVGVFSLEMKGEELVNRIICNEIGLNTYELDKILKGDSLKAYNQGADIVDNYPIIINDRAGLTLNQVKSYSRDMVKNQGVTCIFIDYLQLISATKGKSKYESVTEVSQQLKVLAKDLNVPIFALSQFNRSFDKEKRKPKVSDLRDSGAIEQDADSIILLYNFDRAGIEAMTEHGEPVNNALNVDVAKNRGGECFEDMLYMELKYQRINNSESFESFGSDDDFNTNDPF